MPGYYSSASKRVHSEAEKRDVKACQLNGLAQFSVKEKGRMTLSPLNLRQSRRNLSGMLPLVSPAIVKISNAVKAEPSFESQLEAVRAGQAAASQTRPCTPSRRHASGSSLAPPPELANRPPSTPKKTKKTFGGLGMGTPSSSSIQRSKAMDASTLFNLNPGPDRSCSPVRRPRLARRSSFYCGIPIESREGESVSLIDYSHYELNKLTIATEESSPLHMVPQVFPIPSSLATSRRRPMIAFTKDMEGLGLDHSEGVLRDILEICPETPHQPNPHCILLELYVCFSSFYSFKCIRTDNYFLLRSTLD